MNVKVSEIQKREVAFEVLLQEQTGKSNTEIAKEYGVSPQWVERYAIKYRNEALRRIEIVCSAAMSDSILILMKNLSKEAHDDKQHQRRGRGRPPKGEKPMREIVLEIMQKFIDEGEFTRSNRETMIQEIMKKTDHDHDTASKYFSGYKKQAGDYQEDPNKVH